MYALRYPDCRLKTKSIEELRGIEGQNVKQRYEECAKHYNIIWNGRSYDKDDFNMQDDVNKYLTALNHTLYAVVNASLTAISFSPSIGFIHTGHIQSFVFDIADLYKERCIIPLAFRLASKGAYDRHTMLSYFRDMITEDELMNHIVEDTLALFDAKEEYDSIETELKLWGDKTYGTAGINHMKLLNG